MGGQESEARRWKVIQAEALGSEGAGRGEGHRDVPYLPPELLPPWSLGWADKPRVLGACRPEVRTLRGRAHSCCCFDGLVSLKT